MLHPEITTTQAVPHRPLIGGMPAPVNDTHYICRIQGSGFIGLETPPHPEPPSFPEPSTVITPEKR